ncbi:MAG: peptide ABC transporter substrate-binding protein [Chlamydiales bacterium]
MVQKQKSFSEKNDFQIHKQHMFSLIKKIFGDELTGQENPTKRLPLFKWKISPFTPGAFFFYLLFPSDWNRNAILFVEDILTNYLVPNKQLKLLSSRNLDFYPATSGTPLFFIEISIYIPNKKILQIIEKRLPEIVDKIKASTFSSGYTKSMLKMKNFLFDEDITYIHDLVTKLISHYPKHFSNDIFRDIQHFMSHFHQEFRKIRQLHHLCRIICTHYLFQKSLEKEMKLFPHNRHVYLRLMQTYLRYPFGLKKVLGLAICLNSLQNYEFFELRHIIRAIQRIIPNIRALQNTYYSHKNEENRLLTFYLEIEKSNRKNFNLEDIKKLKKELPSELKNSIEYLSPSLFIPRNEEELIRNIVNLSQELRFVRDIPQAIISFQEQNNHILTFNIILLRVLDKNSCDLHSLVHLLPENVLFISERTANVGYLRKKYIKEANIFSVKIDSQLFLRKNHSVDLLKARQYVVQAVEKMIGPFRDYNGGFLIKQNEQLEAITLAIGPAAKQNALLLENFFYSLSPSVLQTYIDPQKGKILFLLLLTTLQTPIPHQARYLKKTHIEHDSLAIVVKSTDPEINNTLAKAIDTLNIDPLQLAFAVIEVDCFYYQCYLYLNPTKKEADHFIKVIENAIFSLIKENLNQQILYFHLPRAAQSLDPRIGADWTSGIIIRMLYEGLMRITEIGYPEPAIAQSYTLSEDKKTYCFYLRKTIWSNGMPLTAYDFEYAWKKILEPNFEYFYSFLFFPIKNARAVKKGEMPMSEVGIQVLDSYTLVVELEYSFYAFLSLVASWIYSPLCREIDQQYPGWAYHNVENYVCNGPFKLNIWELNHELQVIRNPNYWDASSVKLDKIQFSIIKSEKAALDLFLHGKADWVGDPLIKIPINQIESLKKKNLLKTSNTNYALFLMHLNGEYIPFQIKNMRKAFAYCINREELIKNILQADYLPAYGFAHIPPKNQHLSIPENDPELAKFHFKKGLDELGITLEDFPPILITHSDIEEQEKVSRAIGKTWETVLGIRVIYEQIPWNSYLESIHKGECMVGALTWYSRYEHPCYFYDLIVYQEEANLHATTWKNPKYAYLIKKAKHADELSVCIDLLNEAEKILMEEMPIIPLFYQRFHYVKNSRLKGCILSNTNQIDFRSAYLENTTKETNAIK